MLRADDAVLALVTAPAELFEEESDRPGATADTRAAKPAVSAAAPAMTQRRVRLTRASAASRIKTARDRLALENWSSSMPDRESALSKSRMRM